MGVGEHLKEIRIKKSISLEEIEEKTRIRKKYLQDIEAENYDSVPGEAYTKAFIKSYAECLDLDPGEVLRIYRREKRNKEASSPEKKSVKENSKKVSRNQEIIFVIKKTLPILLLILVLVMLILFFRRLYFSFFGEAFTEILSEASSSEREIHNSFQLSQKQGISPRKALQSLVWGGMTFIG